MKAVISKSWDAQKPSVLVTGGVHGYETSGVQGAILFCSTRAAEYVGQFNIVVLPCVSPWGYEHIERWNSVCLDPNRSFGPDPATHTEESAAAKSLLASLGVDGSCEEGMGPGWICHVDCHETTGEWERTIRSATASFLPVPIRHRRILTRADPTPPDTDETEFMPARAALNGSVYKPCDIPDGFYLGEKESVGLRSRGGCAAFLPLATPAPRPHPPYPSLPPR